MSDKREVRLIDANALFNAFESVGWFDNADRELAEDLILSAHTIDAVPVVTHTGKTKKCNRTALFANGLLCMRKEQFKRQRILPELRREDGRRKRR